MEIAVRQLRDNNLLSPGSLINRRGEGSSPSSSGPWQLLPSKKAKGSSPLTGTSSPGAAPAGLAQGGRITKTPPGASRRHGIGGNGRFHLALYAGKYPVFVVDSYTGRMLLRLGLIQPPPDYHQTDQANRAVDQLPQGSASTRNTRPHRRLGQNRPLQSQSQSADYVR